MSAADGYEPIADDEIVYRRVSENSGWYDPDSNKPIDYNAFKPNKNDLNGLSVWRAKYVTPETLAKTGRPGKRYYVLAVRVGQLREIGIKVEPSVDDGGAGHASLANMHYAAYLDSKDVIRHWSEKITAKLIEQVHGPFVAP